LTDGKNLTKGKDNPVYQEGLLETASGTTITLVRRRNMYLFTMVFIFLTIFGIFTEIVMMQNNRFAAMKTGGAQEMLTWHGAVVSAARYRINSAGNLVFPNWGLAGTPCTVVASGQIPDATMPATCQDAQPAVARLDSLVVAMPAVLNTHNLLPTNYSASTRFNSMIFTSTDGTRLAATFINPVAGDPNAVLNPTGLTASQLTRQLIRSGSERFNFGYVVGNQLQPASLLETSTPGVFIGNYTIPAGLIAPAGPLVSGAIALFTPL